MANIKSAKKRVITNELSRQRNVAVRTQMKNARRKVIDAVEAKDFDAAQELVRKAESIFARAGKKGVIKANTVRRKVSRLVGHVVSAKQAAAN